MQLKWCFVAVVLDFLTTIQGVRDQLLHHLCCELPIADVEAKISIHGTPHILNRKSSTPLQLIIKQKTCIFSLSLIFKISTLHSHDLDLSTRVWCPP
jgi:hypothetical protein